MEKQFVVIAVFCLLRASVAQDPCANIKAGATAPPIPLPSLPTKSFSTHIRGEFLDKNITIEAREYADEVANAVTLVMHQNGSEYRLIFSYNTSETFYIMPFGTFQYQASCEVLPLLQDPNTAVFGSFGGTTSSSRPHMYSTSQILSFINGSEIYKGRQIVDGIPANQWSSCVHWPILNATFSLDYYFTVPGWQTPGGLDQAPLRAEIQGTGAIPNGLNNTMMNFHHIYDYLNFEPYVNDPETIFTTPPGVYCLLRNRTRQLPALQNFFYYREESSNTGKDGNGFREIDEVDIWYDYDLQLVRLDERRAPSGISKDFSQSTGPFRIIHDYGLGVQYTIAMDINECSIDPIPISMEFFDAYLNITRQTLRMRNPMEFFNLDNNTFIYAGQRQARGQLCDVFQTVLHDFQGFSTVIYEVFFLTGAAVVTDVGDDVRLVSQNVPMRILLWQNNQMVTQFEIYDFDQSRPLASSYDVTACFPGQSSIDFEIFLSVPDTAMFPPLAPYASQMMQRAIAFGVGISPLRVQRTRMHWDQWNVYYEATLLDAAPPLAKYALTPVSIMASGSKKSVQNILTEQDCGALCDNLKEWTCMQFDYCFNTTVCTIGKPDASFTLQDNDQCDHFQRVLGGGFDTQLPLNTVWMSLKNMVYQKQLGFSFPLPNDDGVVDLSVDTSQLDRTQKVTLVAYSITDQVVSSVNRNPSTSNVMTNFEVIPGRQGNGYVDLVRGISVDDCASTCIAEVTYNCQSFHYCWDAGACFLSRFHPDERPNLLRNSAACDLYIRDYTSNFQQFTGQTLLSSSNVVYQSVRSASQCAKLCMYYSSFHCESFDYCDNINTCFLGRMHYFDAPKANILQSPSCIHYSRNYVQDFIIKAQKQVPLRDNRIVSGVSPQQCAKLCVEESTFSCNSFDYCGNLTECRLSDASLSGVGQVSLLASAYCDVYSRQFSTGSAAGSGVLEDCSSGSSSGSGNQYSGGSMAGIAIAMIVIGLVLGIAALVFYDKFHSRRNSGDGMAISFKKHENPE